MTRRKPLRLADGSTMERPAAAGPHRWQPQMQGRPLPREHWLAGVPESDAYGGELDSQQWLHQQSQYCGRAPPAALHSQRRSGPPEVAQGAPSSPAVQSSHTSFLTNTTKDNRLTL